MIKKLLLFVLAIGLMAPLTAQRMSWKKLKKLGEEAFEQGNYAEAGTYFEQAWQKKQKKEELIFQAGESYYRIKDYRNAAEAYQHVKDMNDSYPLVGLKYARSLKQDGQYDKAIEEFRSFSNSYTGDGKAILQDIIQTEIQGCQLGKELPAQMNRDMEIIHTGSGINSDAEEFAPYPVAFDELYYSSSKGGKARIYNARRQGKLWTQGTIPGNFPIIQNNHFCNGTFAPDGQRFYFTICSGEQSWSDLSTRCELFYIKKEGTAWSEPQRLPDYVNMNGITSTHPTVAHQGGREVIYYSSNREGGRGSMDLWYITRDLGIDNNDFTFPVNLGPSVNTLGDEITPYYDTNNATLYFSSNGQVSIGGFDIFRTRGEEVNWSVPENVGLPLNSSSDDYFYVKGQSGTGGFMASNRVFGGEKTNTRDADIFEFTVGGRRMMVQGNAYNQTNGELLNDITVSLYQVFDDGAENLLITKAFNGGTYLFEILPDRRFKVEVMSYGFQPSSYRFSTDDPTVMTYGQPVYLKPGSAPSTNPNVNAPGEPVYPETDTYPTTESGNNMGSGNTPPLLPGTRPGTTYTSRATHPRDNFEYVSSAPRYQGVYYKIQLAAVGSFKASKFDDVTSVGRVDTEKLANRNLTRVLVGDFFSESDAVAAMQSAKSIGYENAYVVKYEDGTRYGKVTLK